MKTKILNTTCSILLLIFLSAFGFQDNPPPSGWYQQFMPDLGGRQITDIEFVDSLTGFAVTNNLGVADTGYILKTIDGGDNWIFSFIINRSFTTIEFINSNTGYACGGSNGGTTYICKTTDAGINWFSINSPSAAKWEDMKVLNEDTIYLVDKNGFNGGVFRTINGGSNWIRTANFGGSNPNKIFMYNGSLGFVSRGSQPLLRTIDGGFTWHEVGSAGGFNRMAFIDSITGWKADVHFNIFKTTNSGINWFEQYLVRNDSILSGIIDIAIINIDTLWGVGGLHFNGTNYRSIIHKTTNSGLNWGYQLLDTSIFLTPFLRHVDFVNSKIGWFYTSSPTGIHTKIGGNDTTFYTGIVNISNEVPSDFKLHQNYPNPFNPRTVIRYALTKSADVTLKVYDVTGREYMTLVNQFQRAGVYEVDFMGKFSASGVYFYRLSAGDFSETKRMILTK